MKQRNRKRQLDKVWEHAANSFQRAFDLWKKHTKMMQTSDRNKK